MCYDAKYKVPADAKAVIISPAIVGDRFVQLTPVYKQGDDVLADDAVLSAEDTVAPRSSSTRSTRASTTSPSRWAPTAPTARAR